ncbi:MAG: OmpA family protein [Vicingus serpentipes]|nr:OmpA family protein [Vicingus serpentipes]
MKQYKKTITIIILLVSMSMYIPILAQKETAFTKANFKDDVQGLKKALDHIQEGNDAYSSLLYKKALAEFIEAYAFNPDHALLNAKIGDCYLNISNKKNAIFHFKKAYELDKNLDGYYIYLMGKAFHINHQFDEAITHYQLSANQQSRINKDYLTQTKKRIQECHYAKELVQHPVNVKIEPLGNAINTTDEEYVPVITADESELFFTSRRKNNLGGNIDPAIGDYYEDIYYTHKEQETEVEEQWSTAKNIGVPVNSEFHDATIGLSIDGQQLFIYRDDKKGIGNILVTQKKGDQWTTPEKLPAPINSKHQETSACYSYDGNTIYFVSNRPGGIGGRDIYKATKNKEGTWGEAQNLGTTINTPEDDDALFLHPDGKTLYFSSKGHQTMGGYDVFRSVNENGKWSEPENIGYPINTAGDDVCFVLTASGKYGYYASAKPEGKGKRDIYRITFLDQENKPKLTLLKGIVSDRKTRKKLAATIEIYDNDNKEAIGTFESNSATGKFMVSLPAGRNYGISVKSTGYLFYSENFNIPDTAAFQEIEKNVELDKLEVGKKVVLKNIFYDYNKSALSTSSYNELNKVIELLNNNPKIKIELSSHTDSRGSEAYNDKLSQARAQSCVDYLLQKGITKNRLIAKGYGEKQLTITDAAIEQLTTEQEKETAHQQNRRTEFKIIEN